MARARFDPVSRRISSSALPGIGSFSLREATRREAQGLWLNVFSNVKASFVQRDVGSSASDYNCVWVLGYYLERSLLLATIETATWGKECIVSIGVSVNYFPPRHCAPPLGESGSLGMSLGAVQVLIEGQPNFSTSPCPLISTVPRIIQTEPRSTDADVSS